jgi:hypothetical protein
MPVTRTEPAYLPAPWGAAGVAGSAANSIALRRIPYPYRAILAICSDLDDTPDRALYWETARFLNSTESTRHGQGLGLEVGNSIYFDMPPGQFSYWNTDDAGRAMVRDLIRSGHIDCLHSFGDLARTRRHAGRALDELSRHGCEISVWTDHAVAPSNFGTDIMRGHGDVPGDPAYHADLTLDFGVRYVWCGRVTSVIGQGAPPSLRGIGNPRHPVGSARTIAKELAKQLLAKLGHRKYGMHDGNDVLRPARLRSGHPVWEFIRANPHWGGVSSGDRADGLGDVLTPQMLGRLIRREAVCILYTHLGKGSPADNPFNRRTRTALDLVARYSREGRLLVTTTSRALTYCRAIRQVTLAVSLAGETLVARIDTPAADRSARLLEDLRGLSLHVPDPAKTRVLLNGHEVPAFQRNAPDHTGRPSVSFPWTPLNFPYV